MKRFSIDYSDEYVTCARCHATLCFYLPDSFDPNFVSKKLNIQPTRVQIKGEVRNGKVKQWPTAWFLESEGHVQSKDIRHHIDWLLNHLNGMTEIMRELSDIGLDAGISCFWVSAKGHGGPLLDAKLLNQLCELNLGIDFDIYFE